MMLSQHARSVVVAFGNLSFGVDFPMSAAMAILPDDSCGSWYSAAEISGAGAGVGVEGVGALSAELCDAIAGDEGAEGAEDAGDCAGAEDAASPPHARITNGTEMNRGRRSRSIRHGRGPRSP